VTPPGPVAGTTGPRGTAATAARGGAAIGPGGAVAGGTRVGAGVGPGGNSVRSAGRVGAAAGPFGAYVGAGRVGSVNHRTAYYSAAALRTQGGYVRAGFGNYNCFTNRWYAVHPGAWRAAAWLPTTFWNWAPYTSVSEFCGYPAEPVIYDYGSTVVYEDNSVYYDGVPIATAEEYATQATDLAAAGTTAKPRETDEWKPLGVFAMIQGEEKDSNNLFQIAVNKDGVIRGNYYNALTDTTTPISGSVDAKTQRVAWIVGDKKDTVYETGFGNLSQAETQMLIHFGKERTQQWTLIRLDPPKDEK
jgi:hypothetical protein